MHVLVFPGWYPCKTDELSGDFIQRHMVALSGYCDVTVIFPVKDANAQQTTWDIQTKGRLTECIAYYPAVSGGGMADKMVSFIRYYRLCMQMAQQVHRQQPVTIVQLYVLQKNHLLGRMMQQKFQVPFVVSEQSTAYVDGGFEQKHWLLRKWWRSTFVRAKGWHAVSAYLEENIRTKLAINTRGKVVGNVVDTALFNYRLRAHDKTVFVHVSNMVFQKNVEGMLEAFALAKQRNDRFVLHLVGPMPAHLPAFIAQHGLQDDVVVWRQQTYAAVADVLAQSDVFVFFTRFETFGCVIIEANASGLPVIVTDLPVTRELVQDGVNGLLVKNEDVDQLAEKILWTMEHLPRFDKAAIASVAKQRFNYATIGGALHAWLQTIVADN